MKKLPELPEPEDIDGARWAYTADQMRAYAELAIASVKREPLDIKALREIETRHVYARTATLIDFARAIEAAHGIDGGENDHDGQESRTTKPTTEK